MNPEKLQEVLVSHQKWLAHEPGGKCAILSGENLRDANLSCTNLSCVDLQDASLEGANLRGANLAGADLSYANLQGANLKSSNLYKAYLQGADLRGAFLPSPSMMLLAYWGELSPALCARAMAYDAFHHPEPDAFTRWAEGGACPYEDARFQRACNFKENPDHWDAALPPPRGWDLMRDLIEEVCGNPDFVA
jgi:hypothetical protein